MKTKLIKLTLVFVFLSLFGCGSSGFEDQQVGTSITLQDQMNLRVESFDGDSGVEIVIHRTGLRIEYPIMDSDAGGSYEADLLVRNRYGYPFVSSGNHGVPIDPNTGKTIEDPGVKFDQLEQLADLTLALIVVDEIRYQFGAGEEFKWELGTLNSMISTALNNANIMLDGRTKVEQTPAISGSSSVPKDVGDYSDVTNEENVGQIRQAYVSPYTHMVWIKHAPIWWSLGLGQHSAILMAVFDGDGYFVGQISTRNHGREATEMSGVATGCPKAWGGRANVVPTFQPYVSTDTAYDGDAGGCNTPYNPTPGTYGVHVCNDDSLAMYTYIKYNYVQVLPTCSDSTLNMFAPSCG